MVFLFRCLKSFVGSGCWCGLRIFPFLVAFRRYFFVFVFFLIPRYVVIKVFLFGFCRRGGGFDVSALHLVRPFRTEFHPSNFYIPILFECFKVKSHEVLMGKTSSR